MNLEGSYVSLKLIGTILIVVLLNGESNII